MMADCAHKLDAKGPALTTRTMGLYEQGCRVCGVPVRFVLGEDGVPELATERNTSWRPRVSEGGT